MSDYTGTFKITDEGVTFNTKLSEKPGRNIAVQVCVTWAQLKNSLDPKQLIHTLIARRIVGALEAISDEED